MSPDLPLILGAVALVILSITTHEASHGFVAWRLGDPTARAAGRLTLNPLPHVDLVYTILLPAVLIAVGSPFIFGAAKPVPVNVALLGSPRRDWALVGAAGPLANLAIAGLLAAAFSVLVHVGPVGPSSLVMRLLALGMLANVILALFNLLPVPPLDGSRVAQYFLPAPLLRPYVRLDRFGLLIIAALVLWARPVQRLLGIGVVAVIANLARAFGIESEVAAALHALRAP